MIYKRNIKMKNTLIISIMFLALFIHVVHHAHAEEGKITAGEWELGAAAYFLFVFEGDLEDIQEMQSKTLLKNSPERNFFYLLFFEEWFFPPTRIYSPEISPVEESSEGDDRGVESVIPHLQPIVIDAGSGADTPRPAPKKVEDAKKAREVSRAFNSLENLRMEYFKALSSGGGGKGVCFAPGTFVLMEDGTLKEIQDIVAGDSVIGYDLEHGESVVLTVLNVTETPHENIYLLNESIEATGEHPFYSNSQDPVKVKDFSDDLKYLLGDTDGDTSTLEEIEIKTITKVEPGEFYYDLKFENVHTYFVSDDAGNLYLVRECWD